MPSAAERDAMIKEVYTSQIRMEERQIRDSDKLDAVHVRMDKQDIRIENVEGQTDCNTKKNEQHDTNWRWTKGVVAVAVLVVIGLFTSGVW